MSSLDLLSTVDVAKVLNLSADMVRVLARSGRLQAAARSARGVRMFRRSEVEALRAERAGLSGHYHDVQFYENDDFLVGVVADFLGVALRAGAPAIILATRRHRDAIRRRLKSDGLDPQGGGSSSKVTALDAEETLAEFMLDDLPAQARFRAVLSNVLKRPTASAPRGRPRVYGEMVDLLWRRDQPKAAIKLEELWNDLGRRQPFTLLCGYSMNNFLRSEHTKQFQKICDAHSRVAPTEHFPSQGWDEQMRAVVALQQRAGALDDKVERRRHAEAALRRVTGERDRAVEALRQRDRNGRRGLWRGSDSK